MARLSLRSAYLLTTWKAITLAGVLALTLSLARPALAAQAQGAAVIADSRAKIEAKKTDFDAKVAAVEKQITQAAEQKLIKPSIEKFFREILERFKLKDGDLPRFSGLYIPPRFDPSLEMEPLNVAWTDLDLAKNAFAAVIETQTRAIALALEGEISRVAQSAEKPADLQFAHELAAEEAHLEQTDSRPPHVPNRIQNAGEITNALLSVVEAALSAYQAKDLPALRAALQKLVPGGSSFPGSHQTSTSLSYVGYWQQLQTRLCAPFVEQVKALQVTVERALMERKPKEELLPLITKFETVSKEVTKILPLDNNGYAARSNQQAPYVYRMIASAVSDVGPDNPGIDFQVGSNGSPEYALGAEFSAFVDKVARENSQRRERVAREKEKLRIEETRKEETARQLALAQNAEKSRKEIRDRVVKITDAKQALALADELAVSIATSRRGDDGTWSSELSELQGSLRQLASFWMNSTNSELAALQSMEMNRSTRFPAEIGALWQRAQRDLTAERVHAPELRQAPLCDLPLKDAIDKLATEAGEKGDWKRAYALLQSTQTPRGYGLPNPRLTAIEAYLTGQNFEMAEQWPEAIRAYQSVLMQIADNIPTKQAAERLKELKTKHPEAFVPRAELRASVPVPPSLGR